IDPSAGIWEFRSIGLQEPTTSFKAPVETPVEVRPNGSYQNLGHGGRVSSASHVETLMFSRAGSRQQGPFRGAICGEWVWLNAWQGCSDDENWGDDCGRRETQTGICTYAAFRRHTIP